MPRDPNDKRNFWIGCVGIRADGVLVSARNGSVQTSQVDGGGWSFPAAHAEHRCVKKMDVGGTVYVARVMKDGTLALAKPCGDCEGSLRARGIKRVCYSISDAEYGVMEL